MTTAVSVCVYFSTNFSLSFVKASIRVLASGSCDRASLT